MKELPSSHSLQEASHLWEVLPRSAKDVINCQYKIRDPQLTDFQRDEIRGLHQTLMGTLQKNPQAMQSYLNWKELAIIVFGDMPPIPGIPQGGDPGEIRSRKP